MFGKQIFDGWMRRTKCREQSIFIPAWLYIRIPRVHLNCMVYPVTIELVATRGGEQAVLGDSSGVTIMPGPNGFPVDGLLISAKAQELLQTGWELEIRINTTGAKNNSDYDYSEKLGRCLHVG